MKKGMSDVYTIVSEMRELEARVKALDRRRISILRDEYRKKMAARVGKCFTAKCGSPLRGYGMFRPSHHLQDWEVFARVVPHTEFGGVYMPFYIHKNDAAYFAEPDFWGTPADMRETTVAVFRRAVQRAQRIVSNLTDGAR